MTIKYQSLDDSTAQAGAWDPGKTAQNARKVAGDKNAIGYIGEFNSGATEVSLPILNQAGIPQVSPANTYVGLTTNEPGSAPGEPQKYYPTGKRTYLRIVPRDTIQAAALLRPDEAERLQERRPGQRQGHVRRGPRSSDPDPGGQERASTCWVTRASTRPRRTSARWRAKFKAAEGRLLHVRGRHRQRRGPALQGRQRSARPTPSCTAVTASASPASPTRRRRASRRPSVRSSSAPSRRRTWPSYPGGQKFLRRLQGRLPRRAPGSVRHLRLRGREPVHRHAEAPRSRRRRKGAGPQGAVRHEEPQARSWARTRSTRTGTRPRPPTASTRSAATATRRSRRAVK